MKLKLSTKSFVEAINWVTKAHDAKDDKAHVGLVVSDTGVGHVVLADGQTFMKAPLEITSIDFDGDGVNEARLALEARFIKTLASSLGEAGELVFTKDLSDNKSTLKATRGRDKFTVPTFEAKLASEKEYQTLGTVSEIEYFDALQRLSKLADVTNAGFLPVIGTVDIKLNGDDEEIVIMATDRYALGEISMDFKPSEGLGDIIEGPTSFLLPAGRASLISPSKGADEITLVFEPKSRKIGYVFTDGRIALLALSVADPLPYAGIKENALQTNASALVNLKELRTAIGVVANLAWDETSITFVIEADKLSITDSSAENRMQIAVSDSKGLEEAFTVKFTRSIIMEALGTVATNDVRLKWSSANAPLLLIPVDADESEVKNVFVLAIPEQN